MNDDYACLNCDSHSHPTSICPHPSVGVIARPGQHPPTEFNIQLDNTWFDARERILGETNKSCRVMSGPIPIYHSRNWLQRFINYITGDYFYRKTVAGYEYEVDLI